MFLYLTPSQKYELEKCEKIFKSVFRKFRKSAVFTYMQIDTSSTCRMVFRESLIGEVKKSDAVFLCSDIPRSKRSALLQDIMEEYAEAHILKGCVICCAPSSLSIEKEENRIIRTHTSEYSNYKSAARLALEFTKKRKRRLTICTDDDHFLNSSFDEVFDSKMHIDVNLLSFEEALMLCINTISSFDTVLATKQTSDILQMHIGFNGRRSIPDGYSTIYTKNGKVYERQTFPYEQMDNLPFFTTLLAFSAILENELSMKSAADWTKKAACIAFETHRNAEADDFINKVICEIEKPMRIHTR